MKSSQLIQLMKVLSLEELKAAKKYLTTRVKLPNEYVLQLFLYLQRCAPDYMPKKLDKRKVSQHLFGHQPFNGLIIDKLAYLLKNLLQDFLIDYDLSQHPTLKKQLWLQALEKRNHPDFGKESKKLIQSITRLPERQKDTNINLDLFQLNYALWSNTNTQKLTTDLTIFNNANTNLDLHYIVNKLKMYSEYQDAKQIIAVATELEHYPELLNLLKKQPKLKANATVQLFLATIKMGETGGLKDYLHLKAAFLESVDKVSKKNAMDILVFLNNYCYRRLSKKPDFFAPESYELLSFGDQEGLLVENDRIRDIEYSNGVIVGCYTKNTDWTANFIEKYHPFLAPEIRVATYAYVSAYLKYHLKDFEQVIKLLKPITDTVKLTLSTGVLIQSLLLRAYFEDWTQANYPSAKAQSFLIRQTNNFEQFIIRHKKLAAIKKNEYTQFTRLLRKLIAIPSTTKHPLEQLMKVQLLLTNNPTVALRTWLVEKIQAMRVHLSSR